MVAFERSRSWGRRATRAPPDGALACGEAAASVLELQAWNDRAVKQVLDVRASRCTVCCAGRAGPGFQPRVGAVGARGARHLRHPVDRTVRREPRCRRPGAWRVRGLRVTAGGAEGPRRPYHLCRSMPGPGRTGARTAAPSTSRLVGSHYAGWQGERWLDIRAQEQLRPIMAGGSIFAAARASTACCFAIWTAMASTPASR